MRYLLIASVLLAACSSSPQWSACEAGHLDYDLFHDGEPPDRGTCPAGYVCRDAHCTAACVEYTWTPFATDDPCWTAGGEMRDETECGEWIAGAEDVSACDGLASPTTEAVCHFRACEVQGCTVDSECPDGTHCGERGVCRP